MRRTGSGPGSQWELGNWHRLDYDPTTESARSWGKEGLGSIGRSDSFPHLCTANSVWRSSSMIGDATVAPAAEARRDRCWSLRGHLRASSLRPGPEAPAAEQRRAAAGAGIVPPASRSRSITLRSGPSSQAGVQPLRSMILTLRTSFPLRRDRDRLPPAVRRSCQLYVDADALQVGLQLTGNRHAARYASLRLPRRFPPRS